MSIDAVINTQRAGIFASPLIQTKKRILRTAGPVAILAYTALFLLAGHTLLKEYMPNAAFAAVGLLVIAVLSYHILLHKKDVFAFVLVIYLTSHFGYADNQGGLWNLVSFGMLTLYTLLGRNREKIGRGDFFVTVCLLILILSNLVGWVLSNPLPTLVIAQGATSFFGYILMFQLVRNLEITLERLRAFTVCTAVILVYLLFVALNQRYALINLNTPLLGAYQAKHGFITYGSTNAQGTFRHSELFGEYGVLMIALFLPLFSSKETQRKLNVRVTTTLVIILIAPLCILLTSTRSAAILAAAVLVAFYAALLIRPVKALNARTRQLLPIMAFAVIIPIAGIYIGVDSIAEDFSDLGGSRFDLANIASGKAINRGPLIEFAFNRLSSESWLIGHGFGIPRSNLLAWWNQNVEKGATVGADFHNLYLSLPFLYGWVGSLAFVALIVGTWWRVGTAMLRYRSLESPNAALALGFVFFWGVFVADQYKISVLRTPGYHMMFWIWLGMANALVRSMKLESSRVGSTATADSKKYAYLPAFHRASQAAPSDSDRFGIRKIVPGKAS